MIKIYEVTIKADGICYSNDNDNDKDNKSITAYLEDIINMSTFMNNRFRNIRSVKVKEADTDDGK